VISYHTVARTQTICLINGNNFDINCSVMAISSDAIFNVYTYNLYRPVCDSAVTVAVELAGVGFDLA